MSDTVTVTLRITEADHDANAFWTLGDVTHEGEPGKVFTMLPDALCEQMGPGRRSHEGSCYIADLLDANGDLIDDREIPESVAQALLDEPIPVLRDRFRRWLWETHGATG